MSVVTTVACRTLLESIDGRLKYSDLSPHPGDDALEDQASVRGVLRGFGPGRVELPLVATQREHLSLR